MSTLLTNCANFNHKKDYPEAAPQIGEKIRNFKFKYTELDGPRKYYFELTQSDYTEIKQIRSCEQARGSRSTGYMVFCRYIKSSEVLSGLSPYVKDIKVTKTDISDYLEISFEKNINGAPDELAFLTLFSLGLIPYWGSGKLSLKVSEIRNGNTTEVYNLKVSYDFLYGLVALPIGIFTQPPKEIGNEIVDNFSQRFDKLFEENSAK